MGIFHVPNDSNDHLNIFNQINFSNDEMQQILRKFEIDVDGIIKAKMP